MAYSAPPAIIPLTLHQLIIIFLNWYKELISLVQHLFLYPFYIWIKRYSNSQIAARYCSRAIMETLLRYLVAWPCSLWEYDSGQEKLFLFTHGWYICWTLLIIADGWWNWSLAITNSCKMEWRYFGPLKNGYETLLKLFLPCILPIFPL